MPRIFGRSVFSRSESEPESVSNNRPTHEVPQTQYVGVASPSWATLHIDSIYTPSIIETSRREPEVFNEREDYPEDTPEAIRIRLANLEEIERGLEEDRRRREMYYDFIPESPNRSMLRPYDQYSYGRARTTFTADHNMLVEEYPSHSRDENYHPVISDRNESSFDGTPYIVRTIRYEANPMNNDLVPQRNSELGGTPEGGHITPPFRPDVIYGIPFIPSSGSSNMTGTNQGIYTDTDVGTVLPSTRYHISAGVRT